MRGYSVAWHAANRSNCDMSSNYHLIHGTILHWWPSHGSIKTCQQAAVHSSFLSAFHHIIRNMLVVWFWRSDLLHLYTHWFQMQSINCRADELDALIWSLYFTSFFACLPRRVIYLIGPIAFNKKKLGQKLFLFIWSIIF